MHDGAKPWVVEGGRKEGGRQRLRAMIEFRSDDVRAIADRIAKRASLKAVDAGGGPCPHRMAPDAAHMPDADTLPFRMFLPVRPRQPAWLPSE